MLWPKVAILIAWANVPFGGKADIAPTFRESLTCLMVVDRGQGAFAKSDQALSPFCTPVAVSLAAKPINPTLHGLHPTWERAMSGGNSRIHPAVSPIIVPA
jgi:hypothetical protein